MNHRPRLKARRRMDARAGFDKRRRMDAGARLDDGLAELIAAGGAVAAVGRADGMPQGADELEVQLRGDQIDGGRDSHVRA